MIQVTSLARWSLVVVLVLAAIVTSPEWSLAGTAQSPPDEGRAAVARDVVTVRVSVVVDEERAGSVTFSAMGSTTDGIALGRPAAAGEQTVAVIDQNGTEIDRGRTDRNGQVVLDGLVGVAFIVAVAGIDAYSEDMVLSDGERLDLSVLTYVSPGSRVASSAPSTVTAGTPSVIPAVTDEGDPTAPSTDGSSVPSGVLPVLMLLGGTIFLVSLATRVTTRLQTSRRKPG